MKSSHTAVKQFELINTSVRGVEGLADDTGRFFVFVFYW